MRLAQLVDRHRCLGLVTVAQSRRWKQCAASSQKGRPASSFPCLNPPTAGSQQPARALSPLLFPLWRCSHTSLWRCIMVELDTVIFLPFLTVNCLSCLCAQAQKKRKDPSVIISTFWVWQCDSRWQASCDRLVVKSSATIFSLSDTTVRCENKDSYQNIYLFLSEYSRHNFKVRLVHWCWNVYDLKFVSQSDNKT